VIACLPEASYIECAMTARRLFYYAAATWRYYIRGLPQLLVYLALCRLCRCESVNGFRVVDPEPTSKDRFRAVVGSALALIAKFDRIRYHRVQAEIRTIVNLPSVWGYSYNRPLRMCFLELGRWPDAEDPARAVKLLASCLVHEATLGHIMSRGVLRNRRNPMRFDRLRCKEAQRFLRRLGMTRTPWDPEQLVPEPKGASWRLAKRTLKRTLRDLFGR